MKLTKSSLFKIIKEEILREMTQPPHMSLVSQQAQDMSDQERIAHIRQALADNKPIPYMLKPLKPIELALVKANLERDIPNDRLRQIHKYFEDGDVFVPETPFTEVEEKYINMLDKEPKYKNLKAKGVTGEWAQGLSRGRYLLGVDKNKESFLYQIHNTDAYEGVPPNFRGLQPPISKRENKTKYIDAIVWEFLQSFKHYGRFYPWMFDERDNFLKAVEPDASEMSSEEKVKAFERYIRDYYYRQNRRQRAPHIQGDAGEEEKLIQALRRSSPN